MTACEPLQLRQELVEVTLHLAEFARSASMWPSERAASSTTSILPLSLEALSGMVPQIGRSTPTTSLIVPSLTGLPRIGPAYSPRPLTRWRFVLGVFPRACVNPP